MCKHFVWFIAQNYKKSTFNAIKFVEYKLFQNGIIISIKCIFVRIYLQKDENLINSISSLTKINFKYRIIEDLTLD